MVSEATESLQEPQKRRGRPKGSVNKNKASNEIAKTDRHKDVVNVRLASEHAPGGLESIIYKKYIVGISALPNGFASIITSIGTNQPFILISNDEYSVVRDAVFGMR